MDIDRAVIALRHFVDKDKAPGRKGLASIRLRNRRAIASDGRVMAVTSADYPDTLDETGINAEDVAKIATKLRRGGNAVTVVSHATGAVVAYASDKTAYPVRIADKDEAGTFPQVETLFKEPARPLTYVALSPEYLRALADAAKDLGSTMITFGIEPQETAGLCSTSAVRFHMERPDNSSIGNHGADATIQGLLMPMAPGAGYRSRAQWITPFGS